MMVRHIRTKSQTRIYRIGTPAKTVRGQVTRGLNDSPCYARENLFIICAQFSKEINGQKKAI